jgi:hypothetical protein
MLESVKPKFQHLTGCLNNITCATSVFLALSITLSSLIFLRLNVASTDFVKNANVTLYILMFYITPVFSTIYLLKIFKRCNKQQGYYRRSSKILLAYLACVSTAISGVFIFLSIIGYPALDWLFLVTPVFMAYLGWISLKSDMKVRCKRLMIGIVGILLVSSFLPIATAFVSQERVLYNITNTSDPNQKVQIISNLTRNNLGTYNLFRSSGDYWKYLLVGTGACYEGSMASTTLLKAAGFDARIVAFPGEDHDFTEVKINGSWLVIDPGYGFTAPASREQRANARLIEMGAISYVISVDDSNFTELTSSYVTTDCITIKITHNDEPFPDAQVYLLH